MTYERVYIDLDRTLLDTDAFTTAVLGAVEQVFAVPAAQLAREVPDFYVHHGSMRYYDFFAHVTALGLDPQTVATELHGVLVGGDYLFPDAHKFLRAVAGAPQEASILSYGPADYQNFKFALVPELQKIPFTTVLEAKSVYLSRQDAKPTLLVDDRVVQPLPGWCDQFLIDRSASAVRTQESPQTWRINTLAEVEQAFGVGYNERNQKETR